MNIFSFKSIIINALFLVLPCVMQAKNTAKVEFDTKKIISTNYIGNGVQWDPYDFETMRRGYTISKEDWQKIYDRLDFMQMNFVRVMVSSERYFVEGKPTDRIEKHLKPLLDYCQIRNVTVLFGDWGGGGLIKRNMSGFSFDALKRNLDLLKYLLDEGYSCIKYYNLINEPNGDWSTTKGDYRLWSDVTMAFSKMMQDEGLTDRVELIAPDVAIWDGKGAKLWMGETATTFKDRVGLYDIHTYPTKSEVNNGEYSKTLRAYREHTPADKQLVMTEIGFKYHPQKDSVLYKENLRRIAEDYKFASSQDSQSFVTEHFYGTDLADALFQCVNEGYSGTLVWMLDDAMHRLRSGVKMWGFWHILAEEAHKRPDLEKVRPSYYAWSLLTRYMPKGCNVYTSNVVGNQAVKAMISGDEDNYMLAVVNTSKSECEVELNSKTLKKLSSVKLFNYSEGEMILEGDHVIMPNKTDLKMNFKRGETLTLKPESMIVITNYKY